MVNKGKMKFWSQISDILVWQNSQHFTTQLVMPNSVKFLYYLFFEFMLNDFFPGHKYRRRSRGKKFMSINYHLWTKRRRRKKIKTMNYRLWTKRKSVREYGTCVQAKPSGSCGVWTVNQTNEKKLQHSQIKTLLSQLKLPEFENSSNNVTTLYCRQKLRWRYFHVKPKSFFVGLQNIFHYSSRQTIFLHKLEPLWSRKEPLEMSEYSKSVWPC